MKRHPSLQPLSRDHNVGLIVARHLEREPNSLRLREFLEIWNDEMDEHFFEEERLLLSYVPPDLGARLIEEHMRIRQYAAAAQRGMLCAEDIVRLGGLIHDHIRWEERKLFPEIETSASENDLAVLAAETEKLEQRRSTSRHSPRRGELNGAASGP